MSSQLSAAAAASSALTGCAEIFLLLDFWLVLILSPRLSAMPWDLARIRM